MAHDQRPTADAVMMEELATVIVPPVAMRAVLAAALALPEPSTEWEFTRDDMRLIFPTAKAIVPSRSGQISGVLLIFDNSADAVAFKLRFSDIIEDAIEAAKAEQRAEQQRQQAQWQQHQNALQGLQCVTKGQSGNPTIIPDTGKGGGLFGWLLP